MGRSSVTTRRRVVTIGERSTGVYHGDYGALTFRWYNFEHHHAGLGGYTPEQVFSGRHREVIVTRQAALDENYRRHPERFVGGPPKAKGPPERVVINPYTPEALAEVGALAAVNFPTLPAVSEKMTLSAK